MGERVCTTCVLCVKEDYGYSNWTTEGTNLDCLRGLNPGFPTEEPWRELTAEQVAILDFGATCPKYREGVPAHLDVEVVRSSYTDDPEAADLLCRRLKGLPPEATDGE